MRQRGFSLVEVLVGLLILTIVITTSLAVFIERNRRLQQASETILAYQALANESEYWRRKAFDKLDDVTATPRAFNSDLTMLAPLAPYSAIVGISTPRTGLRNVTLTIRWKNKHEARLVVARADTGGSSLW
jgi:prepilin-type N-terminal cleavage/methylation domain-containing protein